DGGQRKVVDGPIAETKELIAGYTLIQVRSREEAMQWALRFPQPFPGQSCAVEVRQLFELEDFGPSPAVERYRDIPGVGH
ncbi:MAG: YciI family protein, partial [Achromobacter pestifer]